MRARPRRLSARLRPLTLSWLCVITAACANGVEGKPPVTLSTHVTDSTVPRVAFTALTDVDTIGAFAQRDIKESSAAVRSWQSAGVFWTLNDSGNDERLFAFDSTGRDLGTVVVRNAKNRDWESLAAGPCTAGRCLYIGEIGDNQARHDVVSIYRIAEPAPPGAGKRASSELAAALQFRYPDGPRDVEAMWVDADTAVWLATKRPLRDASGRTRPSQLYRLGPELWRTGEVAVATLIDSLPNFASRDLRTQITDAALSNPFGDTAVPSRLAVRTYGMVYVFEVDHASGRPGRLLGHCSLESLDEKQGEGITWLADGRLMFTSEKRFASLVAARCP